MFHVHVHIIPRFSQESPEGKTFPDRKKLGKTEMEEVGRKIRSKVQGDRRVWLTIFLVPGVFFRKRAWICFWRIFHVSRLDGLPHPYFHNYIFTAPQDERAPNANQGTKWANFALGCDEGFNFLKLYASGFRTRIREGQG